MPEDEVRKLSQALVGLYNVVRLQTEAMAHLSAASEAYWPGGPVMSRALFASLPMLDTAISSLERDYGLWKN